VNWFTGIVLYILIWWTMLFAVLPIGTKAQAEPDPVTGWRGAPARAQIGRKVIATTILAAVIWGGAYLLIRSPWLSFRHGMFALPDD
jgi:predicted secreted protein